MQTIYFIPGGFQKAQQDFDTSGVVKIKVGQNKHAQDCLDNEGINGQLFYTGLAWSENKASIVKEAIEYTLCSEGDIEFIEE